MRNLTTLLLSVTTTAVLALPGTANSQGSTTGVGGMKRIGFTTTPPTRQESGLLDICKADASQPGCFPAQCEVRAIVRFVAPADSTPERFPACPVDALLVNDTKASEGKTSGDVSEPSKRNDFECQFPNEPLSEMSPIRIDNFVVNGFVESSSMRPYFEVYKYSSKDEKKVPTKAELDSAELEKGLVNRAPLSVGSAGVYLLTPSIYLDNIWRKQYSIKIICR